MMKKVQKGFTLIELMIVVAIIGILAAIAIPAYQDYTIRSQASEGLTLASSVKASVSEFYADRGVWPTDDGSGGAGVSDLGFTAPPSGKYVQSITVEAGNITITYGVNANPAINGDILVLHPGTSNNLDVIWVCGYAANPATMTAETAAPTTPTDIEGKYVPSNCRA